MALKTQPPSIDVAVLELVSSEALAEVVSDLGYLGSAFGGGAPPVQVERLTPWLPTMQLR